MKRCCNQDPDGVIVYDVVFFPENGDPPLHDVHRITTRGKTEVGEADPSNPSGDDLPLLLDPSKLHDGKRGKYKVIPLQLQVDDWKDDDDDDGSDGSGQSNTSATGQPSQDVGVEAWQLGLIGDMVPNIRPPADPRDIIKHFVGPKFSGADNLPFRLLSVKLRVQVPEAEKADFDSLYEWVLKDPDTGAEVRKGSGEFFSVSRLAAGKFPVSIQTKVADADPDPDKVPEIPTLIDTLNVWIVWAEINPVRRTDVEEYRKLVKTPKYEGQGCAIRAIWSFNAYVKPESLFIGDDYPDLQGDAEYYVPHHDAPNITDGADYGQPKYKWDISRRMRIKVNSTISTDFLKEHEPRATLPLGLPTNGFVIKEACLDPGSDSYPRDPVEGNDNSIDESFDTGEGAKTIDPYSELNPGHLGDFDTPTLPFVIDNVPSKGPRIGDTIEYKVEFAEFCRVLIGQKWYLISDYCKWFLDSRMKKQSSGMHNDSSKSDIGNPLW